MANATVKKKSTPELRVRYVSDKYAKFNDSALTPAANRAAVPGTEIANIVSNLQASLQKLEAVVSQMNTRLMDGGVLQDESPSPDAHEADVKYVKYASSPLGSQLEDLDLRVHASLDRINEMASRLAV